MKKFIELALRPLFWGFYLLLWFLTLGFMLGIFTQDQIYPLAVISCFGYLACFFTMIKYD